MINENSFQTLLRISICEKIDFLANCKNKDQRLLANQFYSKESFFVHRVNVYNCLLRSSYAGCQVRRGADPGKYVCVNTSRCEMFVVSRGSKGGGEHLLLVGMREWNFRWISLPLSCWCYCEMVNCYFQDLCAPLDRILQSSITVLDILHYYACRVLTPLVTI